MEAFKERSQSIVSQMVARLPLILSTLVLIVTLHHPANAEIIHTQSPIPNREATQEDYITDEDKIVMSTERQKGRLTVEISDAQYCEACHVAFDIGTQLLRRRITDLDAAGELGRHEVRWTAAQMDHDICDEGMKQYKPHLIIGCKRLIEKHADTLWAPWLGHHDNSEILADARVLQHKTTYCRSIGACTESEADASTLENTPRRRTVCHACLDLAADARSVLRRMIASKFTPAIASEFIENWCGALSLRHFRPATIVDACSEFLEKNEKELRDLMNRSDQVYPLLRDEEAWERVFCVDVGKLCTKNQVTTLRRKWDDAYEREYEYTLLRFAELELLDKLRKLEDKHPIIKQRCINNVGKTGHDGNKADLKAQCLLSDPVPSIAEWAHVKEEYQATTTKAKVAELKMKATASNKRRLALPNGVHLSARMRKLLKEQRAKEKAEREAEEERIREHIRQERRKKRSEEEAEAENRKREVLDEAVRQKRLFPAGNKWGNPAVPKEEL